MSEELQALARTISEQQKEIDFLKKSAENDLESCIRENEATLQFYKVVHKLLYSHDEKKDYADLRDDVRHLMINQGWCCSCAEFSWDCQCQPD